MLNEPRGDVPTEYLKGYYLKACERIRRHCPAERVAVVFPDGFRSCDEYRDFLQPPTWRNVLLDVHRYQCFERSDIDMDICGHIRKAACDWTDEAHAIEAALGMPAICGEWSLGLDLKVVSLWAEGPFTHALQQLDRFQQDAAYRAYGASQLMAFERYHGWFFWSYRTETAPAWSFRDCVERGWLPSRYD